MSINFSKRLAPYLGRTPIDASIVVRRKNRHFTSRFKRCFVFVIAQLSVTFSHPGWSADTLSGVGQLRVPTQRFQNGHAKHFQERCSGTLVAASPVDGFTVSAVSRIVVSAWHCVERYRDLSRPLVFITAAGAERQAVIVKSGGSMKADWAILRLNTPLPRPALLPGIPEQDDPGKSALSHHRNEQRHALTLAGYPTMQSGEPRALQVHSDCIPYLSANPISAGSDKAVQCVLYKGASGGGVFSGSKPAYYKGVISRGDSQSFSIYVPLERFEKTLRRLLAASD